MNVSVAAPLSPAELDRYGRHLLLPEVGVEGQERLKAASVLLIGAGGLGSPAALYLAAAGVGRIGLIDFDVVDRSNLQRQILYGESDIGVPKIEAAARRLHETNPHIAIEKHPMRFGAGIALTLARDYDVILDGADNFGTRYLANDACVLAKRPNVHGSIFRFEGQASVFGLNGGPCYRCLFPTPPPPGAVPDCAAGGVLGILPGIIGLIQATEALKLLLGIGTSLSGRLLTYDAMTMRFQELPITRDPECPICGDRPTIRELREEPDYCAATSTKPAAMDEISTDALQARLEAGEPLALLDVREPFEYAAGHLPKTQWIPLGELERRAEEVPADREIAVYCRSGNRSRKAVEMLHRLGRPGALNVSGGILAWKGETTCEDADGSR